MAKKQTKYGDFFDEDEKDKCQPLKPAMVRAAEKSLGYRLPAAYIELLMVRNGGDLKRSFFSLHATGADQNALCPEQLFWTPFKEAVDAAAHCLR